MKKQAVVLQITSYLIVVPAYGLGVASMVSRNLLPMIFLWYVSLLALGLALGFGEVRRRELTRKDLAFIWRFSAVFYTVQTFLSYVFVAYSGDVGTLAERWGGLIEVLTSGLFRDLFLERVAVVYIDIALYWMPFVSGVSWFTLWHVLRKSERETLRKIAEQVGAGDAEEAA
jgi:hypothetical protein